MSNADTMKCQVNFLLTCDASLRYSAPRTETYGYHHQELELIIHSTHQGRSLKAKNCSNVQESGPYLIKTEDLLPFPQEPRPLYRVVFCDKSFH